MDWRLMVTLIRYKFLLTLFTNYLDMYNVLYLPIKFLNLKTMQKVEAKTLYIITSSSGDSR